MILFRAKKCVRKYVIQICIQNNAHKYTNIGMLDTNKHCHLIEINWMTGL